MITAVDYEAEYNNRARVPEHPAHIAGWARDAAAWRETHAPRSIVYGPGARNRIDFFAGGAAGLPTRFGAIEGANHFTAIAPLANPGSPMVRRLTELAAR